MSYSRNYQHIVFRTKANVKSLPEAHKRQLFKFIYMLCQRKGWHLERINGYRNHVHLLIDLPVTVPVSDAVREIKKRSSVAFQHHRDFPAFDGWGVGYASFSVSYYEVEHIRNYIIGQEEHHKSVSFEEEFRKILCTHGLVPDEYMF